MVETLVNYIRPVLKPPCLRNIRIGFWFHRYLSPFTKQIESQIVICGKQTYLKIKGSRFRKWEKIKIIYTTAGNVSDKLKKPKR